MFEIRIYVSIHVWCEVGSFKNNESRQQNQYPVRNNNSVHILTNHCPFLNRGQDAVVRNFTDNFLTRTMRKETVKQCNDIIEYDRSMVYNDVQAIQSLVEL